MRELVTYCKRLQVVRHGMEGMDRWLLLATGSLLVVGMIAIYSATITNESGRTATTYMLRHLLHAGIGLGLATAVWKFLPMRLLRDQALLLTLLAIASLLLVHLPIIGVETKGAARWIDLGFSRIQPVEYTKIIILTYICTYCARNRESLQTFKGVLPPLALVLLADVFLLLQPDFGSAAIITLLAMATLFLAGATLRIFVVAVVALVPAASMLILMFPYRVKRLVSFLDPFQDPYGGGYHQTHALMAFGKGGWFGNGLGQSVEKWSHLPEAHTDFIISVLAEETGIFGVAVVLGLYALILYRAFVIASIAELQGKFFSCLLARIIGLMLVLQMTINVAGNLALGPVKGLTLPLVSYGGSSLVTWLVTLALLQMLAHENGTTVAGSGELQGRQPA